MKNKAVFLDRDGVIIEDVDLISNTDQINIYEYVPKALQLLYNSGYKLIIVTNQTVVARGIISEEEVIKLNNYIKDEIIKLTDITIEKIYFCPHHPHANIIEFRTDCMCRKPKPGMLFQAADEFNIDLKNSFMIGDRISDIIAGNKAGCKTIQVNTGRHLDKPIISNAYDSSIKPDYICNDLLEATRIIL